MYICAANGADQADGCDQRVPGGSCCWPQYIWFLKHSDHGGFFWWVILRSHGTKKSLFLTWIVRFRTATPVWITDGFEKKHNAWCNKEEVPYCFYTRSSIKFQGHTGQKIINFDLNWVFPGCNSNLNLLMALKWCTMLDVVKKRCPIVFLGHPSNFKVAGTKKLPILTQIGCFQTVTQV